MTTIVRSWENGVEERDEDPGRAPRPRGEPGPIGELLGQNSLDEAVRSLQEDLAMLQAQQERGLGSLGGALEQIGQELGAVRAQLAALAEPLLQAQAAGLTAEAGPEREREQVEVQLRFERLEKQVGLLMRGLDSVDALRYQSDVHTRALARLTDLLGEVVRPRPIEGLEPLREAVASLEAGRRRDARFQVMALSLLGLGMAPGVGALAWIIVRGGLGL